MKKRYWNELSDKERNKINNEWNNSEWCKRSIIDSKKIKPKENNYYLLNCGVFISCIIIIMTFIYGIITANNNPAEEKSLMLFIFILFWCGIATVCAIVNSNLIKDTRNKYIDEEKSKWLLKIHNIVK